MVSAKFSVVLIAVAVVLFAQLMVASAKPKAKPRSSSSHSHSTSHSTSNHKTHYSGGHSTSNTHHDSNHPHRSSGASDRKHSSDLGSSFSHYDTPSRTSERTRGSGSSSSLHGSSDNSHHDSSSSSVQDQRRGRVGQHTDATSHKDLSHQGHATPGSSTRRTPSFNPKKMTTYQRRKLGAKLSRKQRTQRRQKVRQMALDVRRKTKNVEKKTTASKKGLLNALSKRITEYTGKKVDLGLIWAKLKNSTKECAKDSKDSILDFVTETVSKSVFGDCKEAEKYAKLQKDLDTTKETLSELKSKEKAQLETCSSEEGAKLILDRKANPPKKPATEAPPPIVTKKESASVLDAAANTTTTENDDDITFEDSLDNDDDLFRRRRDVTSEVNVGELVEECRETVRNNTLKWTFKLDRDITSLTKETKDIDQDDVEKCWSTNFGENLGTAGIDLVVNTLSCVALGGPSDDD